MKATMSKNAADNSRTLLRLLADWRKVDFPSDLPEKEADLEPWRRAARILEQDFLLTVHFADWHIGKVQAEDRYYFTLFEARNESLNGLRICRKFNGRKTLKGYRKQAEKLRAQYDSLGSLFITLFELREPLLQERAEAAL
jgi:hypothetical protein